MTAIPGLTGLVRLALCCVAATVLAGPSSARAGEDVVVIVNVSNPATATSRRELVRYFLRQATEWPGGQKVHPVDQAKGSPVRAAFAQDVMGRGIADLDAFWAQAFYSGRAVPPISKSGDAAVVEYVRSNPGAVGYVSAGAATDGVKKLPLRD